MSRVPLAVYVEDDLEMTKARDVSLQPSLHRTPSNFKNQDTTTKMASSTSSHVLIAGTDSQKIGYITNLTRNYGQIFAYQESDLTAHLLSGVGGTG